MTTTKLCILGLVFGVALVSWLIWYGCQIRIGNTRGHRLGKYLALHNGTRTRPQSWWRL